MNSLEFIKQHVTKWPVTVHALDLVKLHNDGTVLFRNYTSLLQCHNVDLSEHFAPSYYDGKVWTREEFEAFGCGTPSDDVDSTIAERGNRYGKFKDGANIMQELKEVMRATPNWSNLSPSQREALEMIQHKIGRVLNGDPNYDDNWRDIAGYSTLILEEVNGNAR